MFPSLLWFSQSTSAAAHTPLRSTSLASLCVTRCSALFPFLSPYQNPGSEGFDPDLSYLIFLLISNLIISSVCKVRISSCLLCLLKPFFLGVKCQVAHTYTQSVESSLSYWKRGLDDDDKGYSIAFSCGWSSSHRCVPLGLRVTGLITQCLRRRTDSVRTVSMSSSFPINDSGDSIYWHDIGNWRAPASERESFKS